MCQNQGLTAVCGGSAVVVWGAARGSAFLAPMEECTHTITGIVTPPAGDMHFVGAHYHCHAPTCLKMEIYNHITGELLCREEPYHGQGADITGVDRFVSDVQRPRHLDSIRCHPPALLPHKHL